MRPNAHRFLVSILTLATPALVATSAAFAVVAGDPDPTWAPPQLLAETPLEVATDVQGRVYAALLSPAGDGSASARVLRFVDGVEDASFGPALAGVTLPDWSELALAIAANGDVYLAGSALGGLGADFFVERFDSSGALLADATVGFDLGGDFDDSVRDLLLGDPGLVLVGAAEMTATGDKDFAVLVLDPGTLAPVTTFGGDGKRTVHFDLGGAKADAAWGVSHDGGTGLVLVGEAETMTGTRGAAVHLDATGTVLTKKDFAYSPSIGTFATATAFRSIWPESTIGGTRFWIAGWTRDPSLIFPNVDFAVARLDAALLLDATYGFGGFELIDFSDGTLRDDYPRSIARGADGSFYVAGTASGGAGPQASLAVARLLPDGTLDGGWQDGGRLLDSLNQEDQVGYNLALDPQGRPVIAVRVSPLVVPTLAAGQTRGILHRLLAGDLIFADGFEAGHEGAWSGVVP